MENIEEIILTNLAGEKIHYKINGAVYIIDSRKFDIDKVHNMSFEGWEQCIKNNLGNVHKCFKLAEILKYPSKKEGKMIYNAMLENHVGTKYEVPIGILTDQRPANLNHLD